MKRTDQIKKTARQTNRIMIVIQYQKKAKKVKLNLVKETVNKKQVQTKYKFRMS